jgi:hypothetical protein
MRGPAKCSTDNISTLETKHRAIAADIGVSDITVGRARKELQHHVAVEERVGLDGKTRTFSA